MEIMSTEEKGYKCPASNDPDLSCAECQPCPYMKTLCIVYSVAGRKKYKEWKRRQKDGRINNQ